MVGIYGGTLCVAVAMMGLPLVLAQTPGEGAVGALAVEHPVMDYGIAASNASQYEQAVARVMALSDEELLSFVPDKPHGTYCECPNCFRGVEGNGVLQWTIERPDELKCRFCGTVYPNAEFPADQVLEGKNRLGETVPYTYHLGAGDNTRHFFGATLLMHRRNWLLGQCVSLGKAYQATGKEEYARPVVVVLDRLAQVYPHYPVVQDLPRRFGFRESQEPPWPWDSGRWGHFHNEIPKKVISAYDLTCQSKWFDKLSVQVGRDIRRDLEDNFLRKAFEAVSAQTHHLGNVVGYDVAGAAVLGRVIARPRYVHWAFGWMRQNVNSGCFFDGMWHESPSYHYMTMGGLRSAFSLVRGYSDPPGYVDEVDNTRFDDLDPERELPFYAKALHAPEVLDFPNGCSTPVHDTHPYERRSEPREETASSILPGFGHASLGRGRGQNQMQAQLHFSGGHGHAHYDNLNLTLWAKQREMLPDLGYTWTQMRYWCTSTLGHNTVVVDRSDQTGGGSDGSLLWYFPDSEGVSVVEADGARAYANIDGLDQYRRLLVQIPVSQSDAYVVDIFRLRGGAMHDWTIQGDADEDTVAHCSVPIKTRLENLLLPSEEWVEPKIEGDRCHPYGLVRDVDAGDAEGGLRLELAYSEQPRAGLRVHILPDGPTQVFLGRSPSVRRAGQGARGDMRKIYDFWMPKLLVRKAGEAPLSSVFAAVHEPCDGDAFIDSVQRLVLTPADPACIALRVAHGECVDTIISTLDQRPFTQRATADGVTLQGRLGLVRHRAGKFQGVWMFDAAAMSGPGWSLEGDERPMQGDVLAALRTGDGADCNGLLTDAELPDGNVLRGAWIIVTHGNGLTHGYEIERVQGRVGRRLIVLARDHGLRIQGDTTREVYFPRRNIQGANTFEIPTATTLVRSS